VKRELITEDELLSEIRLQGIKDLQEVKEAFMEPDGRISVIANRQEPHPAEKRKGV
jgi:uncharacterized membrane protein YcaP (DUF421 family)